MADERESVETPEGESVEMVDGGVSADEPTPLEAAIALQEETEARLRKVSSAYKQAQDDMANFRQRVHAERKKDEDIAKGKSVKRLFEPLQNLRRSVESMEKDGVGGDYLEGLKLVVKSFSAGFQELGLREVPGYGSIFNPDHHEALTMMPVEREALDGRVLQVFSAGYQVGEFLIEPARVVVGKYTAPEVTEEPPAPAAEESASVEAVE